VVQFTLRGSRPDSSFGRSWQGLGTGSRPSRQDVDLGTGRVQLMRDLNHDGSGL